MDLSLRGSPRDPSVAATWVGAVAVVITLGWNVWFFTHSLFFGTFPVQMLPLFVLVPPVNAYLVTYAFWNRYVPRADPLTYRRGAGVGTAAALVSYVTLAVSLALCYSFIIELGFGPPGTTTGNPPATVAAMSAIFLLAGAWTTLGLPIVSTVGVALVLARRDGQDANSTAEADVA